MQKKKKWQLKKKPFSFPVSTKTAARHPGQDYPVEIRAPLSKFTALKSTTFRYTNQSILKCILTRIGDYCLCQQGGQDFPQSSLLANIYVYY